MEDEAITTRPPNPGEVLLRNKFYESIAEQDKLMAKLAGQLLTLELAIPGLYAAMLKLVRGEQATLQLNAAFYLTYGAWLAALALTLYALVPKAWKVDPGILRQDPEKYPEGLGLEDYFHLTARHKRRLLIASCLFFFIGVVFAGFTI